MLVTSFIHKIDEHFEYSVANNFRAKEAKSQLTNPLTTNEYLKLPYLVPNNLPNPLVNDLARFQVSSQTYISVKLIEA